MDQLDSLLAAQAQGAQSAPSVDPIDAMLSAQAKGQSQPAPEQTLGPEPNAGQSYLDRVIQGVRDPLDAGAQLLSHALPNGLVNGVNAATQYVNNLPVIGAATKALGVTPATPQQIDQGIAQREAQYQADRRASMPNTKSSLVTGEKPDPGLDTGRMLGNVIGTVPLAFAAPAGAGAGAGAALGAANGALTPVVTNGDNFAGQKATQIGLGALAGGVAAPLMKGIGNAIAGFGDVAQQKLAQAGVNMTPGQILGGAFGRTEDKLTSVPVLGDLIKNAQQRSVQSFNKATYDEVLAPIGQKYTGPVGNEGVEGVQRMIGDAYDNALSKLTFTVRDPQFNTDIVSLGSMAQNLPPSQAQTFMNVLKTQIFGKVGPQGTMDGQTLKGVQSELSRIARGYAGDPSFDNRQLGQAIGEIKSAVDSSLARTNPSDAAQALADANSAYANFARLRTAAASQGAGNNGGIFTAAQLNNAVRTNDKSAGKGAFATGNALMQDLSSAGQQVLGSKYPDSGTPGRSMLALGLGALGGHALLPGPAIPVSAGLGAAASLPYTTMGQKLAQALLMSRPAAAEPIGDAVSTYGSAIAPALAAVLANGANR